MSAIFEIFAEWFGQGLSFPVVATDILSLLVGLWLTWDNPYGSHIVLGALAVLLLSLLVGLLHNYMAAILSVIVCGISTMFLAGAAAGWIITKIRFFLRKRQ